MCYTVRNMVSTKSNNPGNPQGIHRNRTLFLAVCKELSLVDRCKTKCSECIHYVLFVLWQSKSLPIPMPSFHPLAYFDATLLPITPFRCHPSTHYSIPMASFHLLAYFDCHPSTQWSIPMPHAPFHLYSALSIVCKLVMNKMLRFKSHAIIKFYYCNQVTQIHGECRILMK